jgi:hypothetical protein
VFVDHPGCDLGTTDVDADGQAQDVGSVVSGGP